jgi:hypothetical protein
MILVPLFDLKLMDLSCRVRVTDFKSAAGRDGENLTSRRFFHPIRPKSLRLNAKRGIVACLDAAGWVRIRDDPHNS